MSVKAAFLMDEISIPLERILLSRTLPPGVKKSSRYLMIEASVREVGIIEPPIVYPQQGKETETKLDGICTEAIEALKDKPIVDRALQALKKVKPYRQVEMAELMRMANVYTEAHARALLAATAPDQLVAPPKREKSEQMTKLEAEMRTLERDFVVLEESYSKDTLNLQLARAYLKALLGNARVSRYLAQKHAALLGQLQKVVEATSLEG